MFSVGGKIMQVSSYIQPFVKILLAAFLITLSGCATQYTADADADQLVAAMQDLPKVQPFLATTNFYPELNTTTGNAKATNADTRNLNAIVFSEEKMLNLAGHASIFRWFQYDSENEEEEIPELNIHARIFKLDHSLKVEKGQMRPVAKTKLEIFLTDSDQNRIYESVFTADAQGKLIKRFRNKQETQDMYGYTIYKALTLAFESAFEDISKSFNLKPTQFDIDNIKLEDIDVSDTPTETDNTEKKARELSSTL